VPSHLLPTIRPSALDSAPLADQACKPIPEPKTGT